MQPGTLRTFFAAPLPCNERCRGPRAQAFFSRLAKKIRALWRQRNLSVGKTLAPCLLMKIAGSSARFVVSQSGMMPRRSPWKARFAGQSIP
jgi:hypothetical protein